MTTQTLANFLIDHKTKAKDTSTKVSHTRIGCKENKIFGGVFSFTTEDEEKFYELVYKKVITDTKMEYLTEKQ